ncbi:MAG: glycosyltransferase family 2 protein [Candidatus Woesebacteria bacterium]
MSSIAIILLNYNSTRLTKKCVHSLLAQKDKDDEYQIIVFDNDSKIPPKKDEFKDCDLVHSKKNLGFAQGNNVAVTHVNGSVDYLLFINNDTRVGKAMVSELISSFNSDPDSGLVVPKIYFEKEYEFYAKEYSNSQRGRVIWYAGGGIDWQNMILFHKGVDEVDRGQFEKAGEEEQFATGCCFLTTPAIWKTLKGFDPKYFLYYEDADLSMRLRKKLHKKIRFAPRAILYHQNAGSSDGSGSQVHQYYQTRNRLRFGLRYSPRRTKLALLNEARRLFITGNGAVKLGILHALGGQWGNQTTKIPVEKALAS